nr:retrovirus-related Pol polyprotein from transposon TNT 1-94 [Tanacetum cinerariifolium]
METKFDKPSVVRQPNAQWIPKPSVLGKPAPFSDSLERRYFLKTKSVPKTNVSEGLSKTVTAQTLPQTARQAVSNANVLNPGMYQIDNRTTQTRAPQSPQTFRNTNPRVSNSTGVNHKTNVSRPQLWSNQMKDKVVPNNSQVKLKKTQVKDHPRIPSISNKNKSVTACNINLNTRTLNDNAVCATCGKCLVDSDHFAYVTKMLNDVNARTKKPNVVPISTRKPTTSVSRPQLKSNPQGDRVLRSNSPEKKLEVEEHRRNVRLPKNKTFVTACNDSLNVETLNVKSVSAMCDKCVLYDKHDMCVLTSVDKPFKKTVASESNKKPRNNVRKVYERFGKIYKWSYIKFTPSGYIWKPKSPTGNVNPNLIEIVLFIVDSGCSKHMTGNLKLLINFVEKFLGTVKFGNDQIAPILGYGDLVQGAVTINRVYYVEGLIYNLFSVGQFCDADLEVAFRKSTCFIRNLKGNDLLTGSRGTDLYSITLQDSNSPNPICLMAKATSFQAWLWHRCLSHLNFITINLLSKNDIVVGLPKLKFIKDHLCSSCELGKAKRKSFHSKLTPSSKRRLHLLHMDLCGPMRVTSINGKRYALAARTMLSAAKVPLFFWAEAIATACFTQNRYLVIPRHEKTPYHIINDQKPSVKFFHIFGSVCYIVRDGENLDKMKE